MSEEKSLPPRDVVGDSPYAIFAALCEAAGLDAKAFSGREKGKHLAVAKRLRDEGATAEEVRALVGWLRSQAWRTSPITVFTVEKEIGTWRAAGRPEREMAKRPKSQSELNKGGTGRVVI